MKRKAMFGLAALLLSTPLMAGPYGDALGKCLVASTTSAEKTTLVRWMFTMIALHPDVQSMSAVTPAQRTEVTRSTARLFERLMTESCAKETREAVQYEGTNTIESSFGLLGQVATRELFSNPKVSAGLEELGKEVDPKKFEKALGTPK